MSVNVCHVTKRKCVLCPEYAFSFFGVISALLFWTLIITTKSQRLQSVDLEKTQSCDIQNKKVNMKWPDWFTFRTEHSSRGAFWIPFWVRWLLHTMITTHLTSGKLMLYQCMSMRYFSKSEEFSEMLLCELL